MNRTVLPSVLALLLAFSTCSAEQAYVAPPSSRVRGHVPVISDELMEQCVRTYNDARWLSESLSGIHVNRYDAQEVERYNRKVSELNALTSWFNANCAGKQSLSACRAANRLNERRGLPVQPCR